MPWVRFDDAFMTNRKVDGLSDAAFRLHVSAIFWCARNLTDGVVPEEDLDIVTARVRTPARFAADLVRRGLWHEASYQCDSEHCPEPGPDGWVIHDYLEYQFSKERVLAERQNSADRQKKWREAQKGPAEDRNAVTSRRKGDKETTNNAVSNAVSNGGSNSAPSRPVPKELKNPSSPAGDPEGFADFWAAYPPRKNSSKADALKSYVRAIKEGGDSAVILEAAHSYATDRNGKDQQYTAHASTWLNGKRWENQPEPEPVRHRSLWDN